MEIANELEVIVNETDTNVATSEFVKSSFQAVLHLHEQVVTAKEATLEQLKSENEFLKESIKSIQDIHTEDRQTVEILTSQIKMLQEELEFTKRKYKLMWNKAVENYKK
jgi:nitrous oxide reductase